MDNKPQNAIVIAAFGTTYDSTLASLLDIKSSMQTRYPNTEVRLAFTSNFIRKKWHKRATDKTYIAEHQNVPATLYNVKNVLGTLADLQDLGFSNIVVQPTHLTHGEEYMDTKAIVDALADIETIKPKFKPFKRLALGRPLLGTWGVKYPYHQDIHSLAIALKDDVAQAKLQNRALVYMGHGNEHLSTGLYKEFEIEMNKMYPQVKTFVGLVEGFPDLNNIVMQIESQHVTSIMLRPLMIVAGDHANNDMAGDEKDSWKTVLTTLGINVNTVLEGLGEKPAVQAIFIQHANDAANDLGIQLN
ncbi:sirohydrochlorin cobaltochelatase [Shewanella livingstonensis]|uniref:Sirohydrochlorin cobaltochelatase n=2 Tax=Shewanella livingstonensis TaxID=150120 RepID=A0A3G8M226_9GAMM|nr:sirohydrochlorin cobaltochelatase [Shewanella livingstonensis]